MAFMQLLYPKQAVGLHLSPPADSLTQDNTIANITCYKLHSIIAKPVIKHGQKDTELECCLAICSENVAVVIFSFQE